MSLNYYDVHGYLGQGPTLKGHTQLSDWVTAHAMPETQAFLDKGETTQPDAVARELDENTQSLSDPDVMECHTALSHAAKSANEILILSY